MSQIEDVVASLPPEPERHHTTRAKYVAYVTLAVVVLLAVIGLPVLIQSRQAVGRIDANSQIDKCTRWYSQQVAKAQSAVEDATGAVEDKAAVVEERVQAVEETFGAQNRLLLDGVRDLALEDDASLSQRVASVPTLQELQDAAIAERQAARQDRAEAIVTRNEKRAVRDARRDAQIVATELAFNDPDAFLAECAKVMPEDA